MPLISAALLMARVERNRRAARDPQALLWARTAVFAAPMSADAWVTLGEVYKDLSCWKLLRVANMAATRLDPTHVIAWLNVGIGATAQHRWSEALDA
ncbi:hypothetical protein [Deinococcus navajonensis]|uniref:Uncharacterized protein n=1 Tax=Deinococcus navajonensis TaxID=309884 RepID=A0ABV8XKN6_9DEIO